MVELFYRGYVYVDKNDVVQFYDALTSYGVDGVICCDKDGRILKPWLLNADAVVQQRLNQQQQPMDQTLRGRQTQPISNGAGTEDNTGKSQVEYEDDDEENEEYDFVEAIEGEENGEEYTEDDIMEAEIFYQLE